VAGARLESGPGGWSDAGSVLDLLVLEFKNSDSVL
jgi:hypothetical protein